MSVNFSSLAFIEETSSQIRPLPMLFGATQTNGIYSFEDRFLVAALLFTAENPDQNLKNY